MCPNLLWVFVPPKYGAFGQNLQLNSKGSSSGMFGTPQNQQQNSGSKVPYGTPTHQTPNQTPNGNGKGPINDVMSNGMPNPNKMLSPNKPVNLLPEEMALNSRKLSDREEHDCDIIGEFYTLFLTRV